ncbi:MAG: lyase family protein, partial [Cetobacterium sp.]
EFIKSLAEVKKASIITNAEVGLIEKNIEKAVIQACDEIIAGKLHEEFIVDPIQGGAGTSMNMNVNEVIANRASEILGGIKGEYKMVHPNDHVNYGQSTNDVIPTAGKLTTYKLLLKAIEELKRLYSSLKEKSVEFDDVIKMGRTQ